MSEYEDQLIREATGQGRDFELPEPVETNDSNKTGDAQQGENPNTIRQYRVLFTLRELVNGSFADVQHSTKWFNSPQEAQNHAAMKQENAQVVSRGYLITRKPTPQT